MNGSKGFGLIEERVNKVNDEDFVCGVRKLMDERRERVAGRSSTSSIIFLYGLDSAIAVIARIA